MLVICYYQSLRYEFNIEEEKSFLISSNGKSPIPVSELENDITLKNMQGQLVYIIDQKEKELTNGVEISGIVFYLANNQKEIYTPLDYEDILIGDKEGYHIRFKEGAYYWVSFKEHGIYLFHSVPTDQQGNEIPEEAKQLGKAASHGCVRMSRADAKWFYENIPQGTTVTIK
ncbi:L,D-transpeptidase [Streptococcus agalactiae]|uniref:L,D-transpeptidase n=1 Tax=Streptococcus agalactiae TaxID=1311 RepID=UPI001F5504C9|nr:L,D-transpeptidase [Streptococcus agalactiae]